jgi:hypothetical protein
MRTISYDEQVKANKDHVCSFCGEKIYKGDTYNKSTHEYDGSVYDWKTHKHCADIAQRLNMYEQCEEGVTQDDFIEFVSNKHDDLLIDIIPDEDVKKYSDIIQQLRHVRFRDKLSYVIRHFAKQGGLSKMPNSEQGVQVSDTTKVS